MLLPAVAFALVFNARAVRCRAPGTRDRQALNPAIDGLAAGVAVAGSERIAPFHRVGLLCTDGRGGRRDGGEERERAGDDGAAENHRGPRTVGRIETWCRVFDTVLHSRFMVLRKRADSDDRLTNRTLGRFLAVVVALSLLAAGAPVRAGEGLTLSPTLNAKLDVLYKSA